MFIAQNSFGSHKDIDEEMETEEEILVKGEIKEMKRRKRERKIKNLAEEDA